MEEGSYFGESALSKEDSIKRSASVRCETEVECLSIGKNAFLEIFGEISTLVERNILRFMYRESSVLKSLTIFQMEKFINKSTRTVLNSGDTIVPKNSKNDRIYFIIGQFHKEEEESQDLTMKVFGDLYIETKDPPTHKSCITAASDGCVVYTLTYEDIKISLNGLTLANVFRMNEHTRELFSRVNRCERIKNLDSFSYSKDLGIGGYGVVFKITDEIGNDFALKVISKASLVSRSSLRMIKVPTIIFNPYSMKRRCLR